MQIIIIYTLVSLRFLIGEYERNTGRKPEGLRKYQMETTQGGWST